MLYNNYLILAHLFQVYYIIFSFLYRLQVKPYGVLFTLILTFWIYRTKCPNMTIIPPLTISSNFEKTYKRFIQMKQDQPRLCCTIISAVLVALAVLGHIVSGSSIVVFGLMMAAIIFSRHKITFLEKIGKIYSLLFDISFFFTYYLSLVVIATDFGANNGTP